MLPILRDHSALLAGVFSMMLASGLQGSLLALRAEIEGFTPAVTGLVMSAYYVGFLVGWAVVPGLIRRVGHVRVFAAFAAIASTAPLLHAVLVAPLPWLVARLVWGVALCAVFITAESWLNSAAANSTRGRAMAAYMVAVTAGIAGGQFLLNLASPAGPELFILVSVTTSIAVVPMLLRAGAAPLHTVVARLGPVLLYRISPLATVAVLLVGVAQGALYGGVVAVFASALGLSVPAISLFVALTIAGGVLFQGPIGWVSDRSDRRWVITIVALAATAASVAAVAVAGRGPLLFVLFFLIGGLSLPLYSLCVAHAHDRLSQAERVGASSALLLMNGIGSVLGPTLAAAAIQLAGPSGFPAYLAAVHAGIGLFAIWRMTRRPPRGSPDQAAGITPSAIPGAVPEPTLFARRPAEAPL